MNDLQASPIMYIDDDRDDQDLFAKTMVSLQIKTPVISFWNGEEALDYLKSDNTIPSIIFCDVNMPKMSGFELRKQIHANESLKHKCIPFILYSTNADNKSVKLAYELTVQGYFKKPFDMLEMRAQLKLIIDYWLECKHPKNA